MKQVLQKIDEAGHVAYVVGGAVRDFVIGLPSQDFDVATDADPGLLSELFPESSEVGKTFGVVRLPSSGGFIDIATFREDLEYRDHRHPTGVRFAGPDEDARRRDFTINALFYDPKTSRILDLVGGWADLGSGVIRAIGKPSERFHEDALRLLRAVRFAARFGFKIDVKTSHAIQERARLISKISPERIHDELTLMWMGPRADLALEQLWSFGLLKWVMPEWVDPASQSSTELWVKQAAVLLGLLGHSGQRTTATMAWAAIFLPRARNLKGLQASTLARSVGEHLKFSRSELNRVAWMLEEQTKFREVYRMRESTLLRFVRQEGFDEALELHRADALATDGNLAHYEFCRVRLDAWRAAPLKAEKLMTGRDLVGLGFSPGPQFTEILKVVEDLALERRLETKEQALEYIVKNFVK